MAPPNAFPQLLNQNAEIRGWLLRYESKTAELFKRWKSRWCVLRGEMLLCYKAEDSPSPVFSLNLVSHTIHHSNQFNPSRPFAIKIEKNDSGHKPTFLAADTYNVMMQWIEKMRVASCLSPSLEHDRPLSSGEHYTPLSEYERLQREKSMRKRANSQTRSNGDLQQLVFESEEELEAESEPQVQVIKDKHGNPLQKTTLYKEYSTPIDVENIRKSVKLKQPVSSDNQQPVNRSRHGSGKHQKMRMPSLIVDEDKEAAKELHIASKMKLDKRFAKEVYYDRFGNPIPPPDDEDFVDEPITRASMDNLESAPEPLSKTPVVDDLVIFIAEIRNEYAILEERRDTKIRTLLEQGLRVPQVQELPHEPVKDDQEVVHICDEIENSTKNRKYEKSREYFNNLRGMKMSDGQSQNFNSEKDSSLKAKLRSVLQSDTTMQNACFECVDKQKSWNGDEKLQKGKQEEDEIRNLANEVLDYRSRCPDNVQTCLADPDEIWTLISRVITQRKRLFLDIGALDDALEDFLLSLGEPPEFSQPLEDLTLNEGDEIELECRLKIPQTGLKETSVYWQREDLLIMDCPQSRVLKDDSSGVQKLIVPDAQSLDSGHFHCIAENKFGKVMTSCYLNVVQPNNVYQNTGTELEGSPPFILEQLESKTVPAGNSVQFDCVITADPEPTVKWLHDGRIIHNADSIRIYQHDNVNTLVLTGVDTSMSGAVGVEAENVLGKVQSTCYLTVEEGLDEPYEREDSPVEAEQIINSYSAPVVAKEPEKLKISAHLQPQTVFDGVDLELRCTIDANPEPEVTWYKDGRILHPSERISMLQDGKDYILYIQDTTPEDAGQYMCRGVNSSGFVESTAELTVHESGTSQSSKGNAFLRSHQPVTSHVDPPFIVEQIENQVVEEGEAVEFRVRVVGRPQPSVTWTKDDIPVQFDDRVKREQSGDVFTLVIDNVTYADRGLYAATAENEFGRTLNSAQLEVNMFVPNSAPEGPPKVVTELVDKEVTLGDDVQLSCTLMSQEPAKVTWLKDNMTILTTPRHTLTNNGNQYNLLINRFSSVDVGRYRCSATNKFGNSSTSAQVKLIRDDSSRRFILPSAMSIMQHSTADEEEDTDREQPLKVIDRLKGRIAQEGHPFKLTCRIQSHHLAKPFLHWEKDGKVITQSSDVIIESRGDSHSLTILHSTLEHSGIYRCVAESSTGSKAITTAEVIVKPASKYGASRKSYESLYSEVSSHRAGPESPSSPMQPPKLVIQSSTPNEATGGGLKSSSFFGNSLHPESAAAAPASYHEGPTPFIHEPYRNSNQYRHKPPPMPEHLWELGKIQAPPERPGPPTSATKRSFYDTSVKNSTSNTTTTVTSDHDPPSYTPGSYTNTRIVTEDRSYVKQKQVHVVQQKYQISAQGRNIQASA